MGLKSETIDKEIEEVKVKIRPIMGLKSLNFFQMKALYWS